MRSTTSCLIKPVNLVINTWNHDNVTNEAPLLEHDHGDHTAAPCTVPFAPDWVHVRGAGNLQLFGIILTTDVITACMKLVRFNSNEIQVCSDIFYTRNVSIDY